jgi:GNAT superfamily N-acetyltransferase
MATTMLRSTYERVFHTNGIKPIEPDEIDAVDIWALTCVLVAKGQRGKGLSDRLVAAAVDFARAHGASIVEAYPIADSSTGRKSGLSSGTIGLFERAGFIVHIRPGKATPGRRIVMRSSL